MDRAEVARRRLTGLVAAGVAVAAVVAAVAVPLALQPSEAAAKSTRFLPSDLIPYAVGACMEVIPAAERYATIIPLGWNLSPGGQLRAVIGEVPTVETESGTYMTAEEPVLDPEATTLVNDCLGSQLYSQEPEYREPTAAERLILHDWVRRVQEPCLRAHHIAFESPSYAALMNPEQYLWRMPDMPGADFETRVEIRLACPPMPEYLHDGGIYGY